MTTHHPFDPAPAPAPWPSCTVVIPCYNEAGRLKPDAFLAFLDTADCVRFLFVNDGSRDTTLSVLQSLAASRPDHISILDQQPNRGKAEAVRSGMLQAIAQHQPDCVGFWDADLATPLSSIPHLLKHLRDAPQLQMVFGSRVRLLGHAIHRRPIRHYLGRAFATVVSLTLRLPIYDSQCGAKIFRSTPDLAAVLHQPFQSRWIFDVEIIARFMLIHGNDPKYIASTIYESALPSWEDVAGSKVSPLDFFRAFGELLKIRRTYRRQTHPR